VVVVKIKIVVKIIKSKSITVFVFILAANETTPSDVTSITQASIIISVQRIDISHIQHDRRYTLDAKADGVALGDDKNPKGPESLPRHAKRDLRSVRRDRDEREAQQPTKRTEEPQCWDREEREHLRSAKIHQKTPRQVGEGRETPHPAREGRGAPRLDQGGRDEWLDEDQKAPRHAQDGNRQREVLASHVGHRVSLALHVGHKEGLAPNVEPRRGLASHVKHQGTWAPHVGQKGDLTKEEYLTSLVDTSKRYESNFDFYDSNSEMLHGVVESCNKKGEEHEPSMEEDKGCKEGGLQSAIVVPSQTEVEKLGVDGNVGAFQSACECVYTSFMPLVSRCDVWEESILHRLLAPWDPGVLAHNGRFGRLKVFMESENESMKLSKSALGKKGKTASTYNGGLEGHWSHLDLWHTTWGNGLTCFSSLWLFVCVQEFITSLEHEKDIILSHDIFTCKHCIEKKGGTFVGFYGHYIPGN